MKKVKQSGTSKGVWLGLLAIVALAAGLRFFQLDHLPLWNDESLQLAGISMPYDQLVSQHLKGIDHMPPYSYSIQRAFWLGSKTTYSAKVPGAIAGVAMAVIAFFTFRRSNPLLGLLAAFFTATSLYLVYYSQELRCYIFFGLGLWMFLGSLLSILATPIERKITWYRWVLMAIWAVLAGSFHYAAQLVLPAAGACAVLVLAVQCFNDDDRDRLKTYAFRMLWIFIALIAALAICYLEMKYFMGGKLQGMMNEVKKSPMPPPSLVYDVFLRFTWGNGWRMTCFLAVIIGGAVCAQRRERLAMLFAASLCALSFLLCFYVYPKLGQRPASMMSVRYMFWIAWCTMVLSVCSVHALLTRFQPSRSRYGIFAVLAAVYLACTVPALSHYYRMEAKRMNIATAKKAVEAIGGERLLLLGNAYDMHHLQAEWPTNCTYASLPVYETSEDFDRLGLGKLMEQVVSDYPNIVFKKSSYERDSAMAAFDQISQILSERIRIDNDAHAESLYAMGLNPQIGKTMEYAYLSDESLMALAAKEQRVLLLYPGSMALIPTRGGDGAYVPWRLLQRPQEFEVVNGGDPRTIHVSMAVANVGSGTVKLEYGDASKMVSIQSAIHQVYDPGQRKWVQTQLGLQQIASIGYRIPMQIATKQIGFDLALAQGSNRFRLTPFNQPVLIAPPPAEYTLQKKLP